MTTPMIVKRAWAILPAALSMLLSSALAPAHAQWLIQRQPGIPRLQNGKPNLAAPAPRTADGKMDINGLWMPASGYVFNLIKDLQPNSVPFQPWAQALYKQRGDTLSKDDPSGWCVPGGVPRSDAVPYPFKILTAPGMTVILYEAVQSFRQIFTDGRALPADPNPTWMGYSIGHWEGDDFVVETTGFNDQGWLDNNGLPASDALRVTERFVRKNFGEMDIVITINDAKAYARPWNVTLPLKLLPDTELLEYICSENNKDLAHLVGK
jgi:hypothetical protein